MHFSAVILASVALLSGIAFAAPTPVRFAPNAGDAVVSREYNVPREMGSPHVDLISRNSHISRRALSRLAARGVVAPSYDDFLYRRVGDLPNGHREPSMREQGALIIQQTRAEVVQRHEDNPVAQAHAAAHGAAHRAQDEAYDAAERNRNKNKTRTAAHWTRNGEVLGKVIDKHANSRIDHTLTRFGASSRQIDLANASKARSDRIAAKAAKSGK